jgi:DNA-binding transcriptional regulator of glucitol operon
MFYVYFFGALALAWALQLWLTARQAKAFMETSRKMRREGRVSIGLGGKRWKGGRYYLALAFDDRDRVISAMALHGVTTFARPKPAEAFIGQTAKTLAGPRDIPGASARDVSLRPGGGGQPATGTTSGEEEPATNDAR